MKSEVRNMSEKLHTQMTTREETKNEGRAFSITIPYNENLITKHETIESQHIWTGGVKGSIS